LRYFIKDIKQPTLILDKAKCLDNIVFMADKAKKNQLHFRPHFKTHQSVEIGNWFRQYGVNAITVSSVSMAKQFAQDGWKDITIAFPVNILEIDDINSLSKTNQINLLAENLHSLEFLNDKLVHEVGLFIKIDTGYHRSGIYWNDFSETETLLHFNSTSSKLQFKGFLTHSGHTYSARSKDEIIVIHNDSIKKMSALKDRYLGKYPTLITSIGDTPSCSICNDFSQVDEIRPGNFALYDVMQYLLGSCNIEQIAVSLACPVVSVNKERNEFVIYGGAIHLSKESVLDNNGKKIFGLVVEYDETGWGKPVADTYVSALSQEHGIIKTSPEFIDKIKTGKIVGILPVHSCLTVFQMKKYLTTNNELIDN